MTFHTSIFFHTRIWLHIYYLISKVLKFLLCFGVWFDMFVLDYSHAFCIVLMLTILIFWTPEFNILFNTTVLKQCLMSKSQFFWKLLRLVSDPTRKCYCFWNWKCFKWCIIMNKFQRIFCILGMKACFINDLFKLLQNLVYLCGIVSIGPLKESVFTWLWTIVGNTVLLFFVIIYSIL